MLWPLIATALARNESERAFALAKGMFAEGQHPMHDDVMSALTVAVESNDVAQLRAALETAERHRYV